jgi:predicted ATP-binding protein involved in virulence
MYLKDIEIRQIRSIKRFEMTFKEPVGWHVLIGDNGAGKSTIVKATALALLELNDINATRENWKDWLNQNSNHGQVTLGIFVDERYETAEYDVNGSVNSLILSRKKDSKNQEEEVDLGFVVLDGQVVHPESPNKNGYYQAFLPRPRTGPWFSVAYGPYRRFTGGNTEKEKLFASHPRLGAHLSVFGEDIALSEALAYLRELYIKKLEKRPEGKIIDWLFKFINEAQLLPHGTKIKEINSDGIFFTDGNGNTITAVQMSDGFRSVLSLTFELIRQLIRAYGQDAVFKDIKAGNMVIDLPGVVLIDEIDAHLHPTWQTRIGFWFLQYFPSLQFIVTTHSPLICRACEKGSIWRLAAPGSQTPSGEVTGTDRDRLIFGNVLDAYGTEAFGRSVERSQQSKEMLDRLAKLSALNSFGKISAAEKSELEALRKILPTDDTTEF